MKDTFEQPFFFALSNLIAFYLQSMASSHNMDLDKILLDSQRIHLEGNRKFEKELRNLKQTLNSNDGFLCDICNKVIKHRGTFNRHLQSHKKYFKYFLCDVKYNREDNLKKHERNHLVGYQTPNNQFKCQHCALDFNNYTTLFHHVNTTHSQQQGGGVVHQTSTKNALEDSVHVLNIYPVEQDKYDLLTFFTNIRDKIEQHLKERCDRVKHVKWYLNVQVEFIRETHEGEVNNSQPYFRSKTYTLLSRDDASNHEINEAYQKQFQLSTNTLPEGQAGH